MKKIAILVLLVELMVSTIASPIVNKYTPVDDEVMLVKSKGDVLLYEKSNVGDNTKEYIATFNINASIDQLISLIRNEEFALTWIKSSYEYNDIRFAENNWSSYIRFAPPWPLNHQDCILQFNIVEINAEKAIIAFKNNPEFIPVKEKVTRLKEFEGRWELEHINNDTSKVSFVMYSEKFPSNELKKTIILNTILNSLDTFKEKAMNIKRET